MREVKVYCIDPDIHKLGKQLSEVSNNEFMTIAEFQGLVYSLQGFEDHLNQTEAFTWFIRFIEN